jgi:hypothetical protein
MIKDAKLAALTNVLVELFLARLEKGIVARAPVLASDLDHAQARAGDPFRYKNLESVSDSGTVRYALEDLSLNKLSAWVDEYAEFRKGKRAACLIAIYSHEPRFKGTATLICDVSTCKCDTILFANPLPARVRRFLAKSLLPVYLGTAGWIRRTLLAPLFLLDAYGDNAAALSLRLHGWRTTKHRSA